MSLTFKVRDWRLVAALLIIVLVPAAIIYHYFFAEHVIYSREDTRSGLEFTAFCRFDDLSYRTYVRVSVRGGRIISLNETPYSMDMLSDCTKQKYNRVVALEPNADYSVLLVHFASKDRPPVEVPLLLRGLDLPSRLFPPERGAR